MRRVTILIKTAKRCVKRGHKKFAFKLHRKARRIARRVVIMKRVVTRIIIVRKQKKKIVRKN